MTVLAQSTSVWEPLLGNSFLVGYCILALLASVLVLEELNTQFSFVLVDCILEPLVQGLQLYELEAVDRCVLVDVQHR